MRHLHEHASATSDATEFDHLAPFNGRGGRGRSEVEGNAYILDSTGVRTCLRVNASSVVTVGDLLASRSPSRQTIVVSLQSRPVAINRRPAGRPAGRPGDHGVWSSVARWSLFWSQSVVSKRPVFGLPAACMYLIDHSVVSTEGGQRYLSPNEPVDFVGCVLDETVYARMSATCAWYMGRTKNAVICPLAARGSTVAALIDIVFINDNVRRPLSWPTTTVRRKFSLAMRPTITDNYRQLPTLPMAACVHWRIFHFIWWHYTRNYATERKRFNPALAAKCLTIDVTSVRRHYA